MALGFAVSERSGQRYAAEDGHSGRLLYAALKMMSVPTVSWVNSEPVSAPWTAVPSAKRVPLKV